MHLTRWITALIALPILIYILLQPPVVFSCLITVVSILGLREYYRIVLPKGYQSVGGILPICGYLAAVALMWVAHCHFYNSLITVIAIHLMASGTVAVLAYRVGGEAVLETVSKQVQGVIYVPLLLCHLVLVRQANDGTLWIFWLLCLVFANDTGAYYAGSRFGHHKLSPSVSPGKTIEGAVGGLIACMVVGSLYKLFFLNSLPWGPALIFLFCVGVVEPLGDLFESALKRAGNIKDSGRMLPGHGGLLDRIDGLMFTAPVAYLFQTYFI